VSAEWRADDAPAYPQTDEEAEEAELRSELLKLEAEGTRLVLAYADGEIDLDQMRAGLLQIKPRRIEIETELGLESSYLR
jgi:hypothetical protein